MVTGSSRLAVMLLVSLAAPLPADARVFPPDLEETVFVAGLRRPTALAWGPDGEAWIAGKEGEVWLFRRGQPLHQVAALSVETDGERGVSGIAVDPDYATNRHVWVYYTTADDSVHNRLSRFTHGPEGLQDEVVVIDFPPLTTVFHNGGCLRFAPDGTLFVSVGDGGEPNVAPDPADLRGKILRIHRDGSGVMVPLPDPGFIAPDLRERPEAVARYARVWASGFRNPWRFNLQPGTGALFIGDVGETSWEEVDVGVAGGDFGWPVVEGPEPPGQAGYVYPIFAYRHGTQASSAITGGDHARPGDLTPAYTGQYFFGDSSLGHLYRMALDGANRPTLTELWATDVVTPVDIQFGPDGALYYVAYATGELMRIGPRGP